MFPLKPMLINLCVIKYEETFLNWETLSSPIRILPTHTADMKHFVKTNCFYVLLKMNHVIVYFTYHAKNMNPE